MATDTDRPGSLAQNSEKQPAGASGRLAGNSIRRAAAPGPGVAAGISGKNSGRANLKPFRPGESGNRAGRPRGDALMRRKLLQSFKANQKEAMAALARRWGNPKYVQDMCELLAKLEGEFSKETGERPRGVSVILLRNEGPFPLDPETFRAAVARAGRSRHARPTVRAPPGSSCVRDSLGARVPSAP
jgi:hypothetical protein